MVLLVCLSPRLAGRSSETIVRGRATSFGTIHVGHVCLLVGAASRRVAVAVGRAVRSLLRQIGERRGDGLVNSRGQFRCRGSTRRLHSRENCWVWPAARKPRELLLSEFALGGTHRNSRDLLQSLREPLYKDANPGLCFRETTAVKLMSRASFVSDTVFVCVRGDCG